MSVAEVHRLHRGNATITTHVRGNGPLVALVPSLGRAASDFDHLARRLTHAGYTTAAIDPRGLDGAGIDEPLTLRDLAADTALAIETLELGTANLVGHRHGNRVSLCLTADRPDLVASLALLAAGGLVEPFTDALDAVWRIFDLGRDPAQRLLDVGFAFFATGNDVSAWRDGCYPAVADPRTRDPGLARSPGSAREWPALRRRGGTARHALRDRRCGACAPAGASRRNRQCTYCPF